MTLDPNDDATFGPCHFEPITKRSYSSAPSLSSVPGSVCPRAASGSAAHPTSQPALDRQLASADSAATAGRSSQGARRPRGRGSRRSIGRSRTLTSDSGSAVADVEQGKPARRRSADPKTGPGYINGRLDLDVATAAQIDSLPGIIPAIAKRIASDRMRRGPFLNLDGLRRVSGVGPALAKRLDSLVTFSGALVQGSRKTAPSARVCANRNEAALCDLRRSEQGRRHQRRRASEPGKARGRLRNERRLRRKRGQRALTDDARHHRSELVPRLGDLAADEDLGGVERVDDHREAAAQMTRRFLERIARAPLPRACACDDVVDGESRPPAASPGFRRRKRVSEVPGERGEVGGVRLETAMRAAQAFRPARIDRHVSELARGVVVSAHHLAIHDDSRSDAIRHGHVREIARRVASRCPSHIWASAQAIGAFSMCTARPVACDRSSRMSTSRQPSCGALSTRPVLCSTIPGTTSPMPLHFPAARWAFSSRAIRLARLGDECLGVDDGVERVDRDGGAAEIGELKKRATEAYVDRHDESVARAHAQHHGLSAAGSVDRVALVDRPVVEQLPDDRGDHASADAHPPREVGPRDRLVLADEIEHDLAVDLARGRSRRPDEAACVDLSHCDGRRADQGRLGER